MTLGELQADFGRWLREECPRAAARLAHAPGLDVYLNNYRCQLIDALEAGFPNLRRWIGEAAFLSAAAIHIDTTPPHEWTLDAYGASFSNSVVERFPDNPAFAELAQIERALAEAFIVADVAPLTAAAIRDVDWDAAEFRFAPSVSLVPVKTNAAAIWRALADDAIVPVVEHLPSGAAVLVWRDGLDPAFRTVEAPEANALRRLQAGATFGSLCTDLVAAHGADTGSMTAGEWLGRWLKDGLISEIR
ncbi:HvfC/BufC family peptide modification chaperone [Sphingomonas sp. RS6]